MWRYLEQPYVDWYASYMPIISELRVDSICLTYCSTRQAQKDPSGKYPRLSEQFSPGRHLRERLRQHRREQCLVGEIRANEVGNPKQDNK